jgi:Outer membrane protein beta-barrel domain
MKRWISILLGVCALAAALPASAGPTNNPLGFYLGAGVGASNIGQDYNYSSCYGYYYSYYGCNDWNTTGWKVFGGLRPIPFLGAQLEYTDFGSLDFNPYRTGGLAGNVGAHAASAFALAYLPLPLFMDLYAKAGVSRLASHTDVYPVPGACGPGPGPVCSALPYTFQDRTTTEFGYGGGFQWRFSMFAIRFEYERIGTQSHSPALLSGDFAIIF